MYVGKLVQLAAVEDLYRKPLHPYTETLLHPSSSKGEVADPSNPPSGCCFYPRQKRTKLSMSNIGMLGCSERVIYPWVFVQFYPLIGDVRIAGGHSPRRGHVNDLRGNGRKASVEMMG